MSTFVTSNEFLNPFPRHEVLENNDTSPCNESFNIKSPLNQSDISPAQSSVPLDCIPQPVSPKLPLRKYLMFWSLFALWLLLFSAYLGSIFLHAFLIPLAIYCPYYFRRLADLALTSWLLLAEFIISRIFGVRVRHFGDEITGQYCSNYGSSILILNHRTQLDWFFIWGLGNAVQQMKIILKESLAKFPGAGWAMQCGSFIFLRRQIATDRIRLDTLISYLLESKKSCQLLLFPEGTDLNKKSLARSDQYASQNNLPLVRYTLHPRCTGFIYLINSLKTNNNLTEVYDVTVAYPDILPSPEINFFLGHVPREVHYHVRRYSVHELPLESDGNPDELLANWLQSRWLEKEQMLKDYYAKPIGQRRFPNEIAPKSLLFRITETDDQVLTVFGALNTSFWFVFLPFVTYLVYYYFTVKLYFISVQLLFLYLTWYYDGVQMWATKWVPALSKNGDQIKLS